MILQLDKLALDKRLKFEDLVNFSRNRGTYLPHYIQKSPISTLWLFIISISFILVAIFNRSYSLSYWLVFIGPLIFYLFYRKYQLYWNWKKLGRNSVFFNDQYFISLQEKTIHFVPLNEFKYSDIILAINGQYYLCRFHFKSVSFLLSTKIKNDERVLNFQNLLYQHTHFADPNHSQINHNEEVKYTFYENLMIRRNPILCAVVLASFLWVILPNIIDTNNFNHAKEINTATGYREYLSENQNIKYRDEARNQINSIYNHYISKYRDSYYLSSEGGKAIVETLEYLRDNNIYNIELHFASSSHIKDIYSDDKDYNVIPIESSFTNEKNHLRENEVLSTIKSSFGKLFPADIFNVSQLTASMTPRFEIFYIYKNSNESLYFNEKEINLPNNKKTWYYGIEINWIFRIVLPANSDAIYEFELKSKPAEHFNSESFNPDNVYTNMAISAFDDFENEFSKQFLR